MNETPTPPEGYSIIPRAYLEAGTPLPMDAIVWNGILNCWTEADLAGCPAAAIRHYATAQPLPCFQKGGDEPCRTILDATTPVSDTDGLAGERPVPSVPSNAPVAVQSPDQGPEQRCTNHFSDGSKIFPNRDCCKGPEHNPDGLTPEQYGAPEWRLLTKEEVRRNVELNAGPSREIESWKDGRFWEPGYCGAASDITYRRRVALEPTAEQRIAELERDNAALWEQLADRDKLVADYRAQLAASEKALKLASTTMLKSMQHHGCDPCHLTEAIAAIDTAMKEAKCFDALKEGK